MHAREAEGHVVGTQAPQAAARIGARHGEHRPVRPVQAQFDRLTGAETAPIERHPFARLRGVVAHAGVGVKAEQKVRCHDRRVALVADHHHLVNTAWPIGHGQRPVAMTFRVDCACEDGAAGQAFGIHVHRFARPEVRGPDCPALARCHHFGCKTGERLRDAQHERRGGAMPAHILGQQFDCGRRLRAGHGDGRAERAVRLRFDRSQSQGSLS